MADRADSTPQDVRRLDSTFCKALLIAWAIWLASIGTQVRADDTDIYLKPNVPTGGEPLVMFVLDYRPNLNSTVSCAVGSPCDDLRTAGYLGGAAGSSTTFFDLLRAVFKRVLDPLGGVKIGFMINHQYKKTCEGPSHDNTAGCSNGAYVLQGFLPLSAGSDDQAVFDTVNEDANKLALFNKLDAIIHPLGNTAHPYQGKEVYFEFFRYLTGQGIYNGHVGLIDFGDLPTDANNLDVDYPAFSWDVSIENPPHTDYISPLASVTDCSKIFVVNLMFQVSQQEDDSDNAIKDTKANGGMAGIDLNGVRNSFDTVIEYMNDVDLADGSFGTAPSLDGKQNVVSYFLVDPVLINQTTTGYAVAGGTGVPLPLSDDPEILIDTLNGIFKSILSVSTTFVAPSIPVNVFNRAQTLNEVYMALFQADEDGFPFWPGNLKKLVIAPNAATGNLELQDTSGVNAIDIDGRIKRTALTFWTDSGSLPPPDPDEEVAGADGRSVKRGGAGQKVPGFVTGSPGLMNAVGARQIYTEDPLDATDGLMPLHADGTTADSLWPKLTEKWSPAAPASYAAAPQADKDRAVNTLRMVRGLGGNNPADSTTVRDWILADPLHSRPRPVNYGSRSGYSTSNPDIRILVGTNDGAMHMITNTTTGGGQDGSEAWAFIPRSALPILDRLRANSAGTPVHPLGADGSPVVLLKDDNLDGTIDSSAGDKAYVYFGMRRGGKSYYALDISDPDAPKFVWSISSGDTGFEELGQTWSTPQLGRVDIGSGAVDVLVFAGGYNGDDDGDNLGDLGKDAANRNGATGTDDDEGHAIYVVDALTGTLIWKASGFPGTDGYVSATNTFGVSAMVDSIPADLAVADTTGNGLLDRAYVGDTGGVVWRVDMAGTNRSTWQVTALLNAGRHFSGSSADDRRFFNRADIVRGRDANGINYDAILIGSGDREDPLDTTINNYFYMIKDKHITSGSPGPTRVHSELADLTIDCIQDNSCASSTLTKLDDAGWFIMLDAASGEKNLAPAVTIGGVVLFTTFRPDTAGSVCDLNEGGGRLYALNVNDASGVVNFDSSNDSGGVTPDRFDDLESGGIPVEVVPLGSDSVLVQGQQAGENILDLDAKTEWRTYWYEIFN